MTGPDRVCRDNDIDHRLTKVNHPWRSEDQKMTRGIIFPRDGPPFSDCQQLPAGQRVERMNRTIKKAPVRRDHDDTHSHSQLQTHITDFVLRRGRQSAGLSSFSLLTYTYARRLKTLQGLTPFEYICKIWTSDPDRFNVDPTHHTPAPNT